MEENKGSGRFTRLVIVAGAVSTLVSALVAVMATIYTYGQTDGANTAQLDAATRDISALEEELTNAIDKMEGLEASISELERTPGPRGPKGDRGEPGLATASSDEGSVAAILALRNEVGRLNSRVQDLSAQFDQLSRENTGSNQTMVAITPLPESSGNDAIRIQLHHCGMSDISSGSGIGCKVFVQNIASTRREVCLGGPGEVVTDLGVSTNSLYIRFDGIAGRDKVCSEIDPGIRHAVYIWDGFNDESIESTLQQVKLGCGRGCELVAMNVEVAERLKR